MEKQSKKKLGAPKNHPKNLVIDYGNTLVKAAIFENENEIDLITTPELQISDIVNLQKKHNPERAIISSVVEIPVPIKKYLESNFHFIELSHLTPVPIFNNYKTPETLGRDRLAVAVAASGLFTGYDALVIDAGTCVTFDFIDAAANYHGGGISPGISMRFKALHTFTKRLPLVKSQNFESLSGTTTEESILSGVFNGIVAEFDGIISRYRDDFPDLKVLVTGGDVNFFAKKLKSNIFAVPNLVLKGLNVILNFNVDRLQENH